MERNPSKKADSYSVTEDILNIVWHLKYHHHVLKGLPLEPIIGHKTPLDILKIYFFKHTFFALAPSPGG
jgi:hypothetical protein